MLRAHPRIYISHEASFYIANRVCPTRATGREFLEYYFQTWWFRWLRLSPDRVLASIPEDLPRKQVGVAFTALMREKAAAFGRPRFGDKTPGHSVCLQDIFADFPDARVLHIVRDPRPTVQSLQQMPWMAPGLVYGASYLADERKQMAKFSNRVHEVRLEDLLANPRVTMRRVLEYVEEPWDDAVLDHARNLPEDSDIPPLPWHERATRDRSADAPREPLTPLQIRVIEHVAKQAMKEGGYEIAKLAREPSRFAVWWAIMRELPAMCRAGIVGMQLGVRLRRDPRTFDREDTQTLMKRLNPAVWQKYTGLESISPPLAPRLLLAPGPRSEARSSP
jgi:hypothetical protein